MQRILDLDLDFFVDGVIHSPNAEAGRPDSSEQQPWHLDDVLAFLTTRCGLRGALPGRAVETHEQLFPIWRRAIKDGRLEPPFHVTHVDAHGDLGFGDASYVYLMTELLFAKPVDRQHPRTGERGLAESNYLAFAIACRWISDLVYVFCPGGGDDVFPYYRAGFDRRANAIQLAALSRNELERLKELSREQSKTELERFRDSLAGRLEPAVPLATLPWRAFRAMGRFDAIFLARSPSYAPAEADVIYDEIRGRFIDEDGGF